MKSIFLMWVLGLSLFSAASSETLEQKLSGKLAGLYALNELPEAGDSAATKESLSAGPIDKQQVYPQGLFSRTAFRGTMFYLGGGLLGGFIGYEMADAAGETHGDGFGGIPYVATGILLGAAISSSVGIHLSAKQHCQSSIFYAAGGVLLCTAAGIGLGVAGQSVMPVIITMPIAPIAGTGAYLKLGKPADLRNKY